MNHVTEHVDFESSPDAYQVKLDAFEGPLDLLLHLIRKNEVNIYDIPIALITEQFLGYIELMQDLNLDVAGEFLVVAATLIHIKSRTLLPRPDPSRRRVVPKRIRARCWSVVCSSIRSKGCGRPAARSRDVAQRAVHASGLARGRRRGRRLRTGARSRSVQPARGLPGCAGAGQPPAEHGAAAGTDADRDAHSQVLARLSETEACGFDDLFDDGMARVRS